MTIEQATGWVTRENMKERTFSIYFNVVVFAKGQTSWLRRDDASPHLIHAKRDAFFSL